MPEFLPSLPEVYVQPGESRLVTAPSLMKTLLGSCVGITFWAPHLGIAGLCHPMLPHCPDHRLGRTSVVAGRRYVDFAIRDLAQQLDAHGARRGYVHVKLFGGCDVLPVSNQSGRPTVGRLNYEAALRILESEGFRVSASCLGGSRGITIFFNTESGEVFLRRLSEPCA